MDGGWETYIFFVKLLGTMREENGIIEIERAIDKLSRHHIRHIKVQNLCICDILFSVIILYLCQAYQSVESFYVS